MPKKLLDLRNPSIGEFSKAKDLSIDEGLEDLKKERSFRTLRIQPL